MIAAGAAGCLFSGMPAMAQTFNVNFSNHSGPDLVKNKIGVYQTPFWFKSTSPSSYNMAGLLQEAGVKDMRYEMGWGKPDAYAYDQINGPANAMTIDFSRLDPFVDQMNVAGVTPLFAMTYDPLPLKTGTDWQRWKDSPSDLNGWRWINQQYAAHYASKGAHPYYEMWNEPDLPGDGGKVFFNGDPGVYGNVYSTGVAGIRTGSSVAKVGGPAIAYDTSYANNSGIFNQPMDFFSIHAYANYPAQIQTARNSLAGRNIPIFMTEYASYANFAWDGPNSRHQAAAAFFEDVKGLFNYPDVQKVYWAMWIDDTIGMLNSGLHRKALFNAYKIFQTMLPVTRNAVSPDGASGVNVMAASSGNTDGVVVWNNNTGDCNVTVNLGSLPFSGGILKLYRIDGHNASYIDDNAAENLNVNGQWTFSGNSTAWTGTVPAQSVVYLQATASGGSGGIADGTYKIVASTTGNVLDCEGYGTTNGTRIHIWPYNGTSNQKWNIHPLGNGFYSIRTINPDGSIGRSLDCTGCSPNNGTQIELYDYWGGSCQQWQITPTSGGNYKISTAQAKSDGTFDVLDGENCSGAQAAYLLLWSWGGGGCQQQWQIAAP